MMNKLLTFILVFPVWVSSLQVSSLASDQAVVYAVLFYSPNCGHCHLVITETLPPLVEQYGNQLSIMGVDVTQPDGQALFMAALRHFNLESGGVPFLVVGDTYLVGSLDIPEKFPGLIEQFLAQGGVDWPALPGLSEAMAPAQPTEVTPPVGATPTIVTTPVADPPTLAAPTLTPTPGLILTNGKTGGPGVNFALDPLGNSLAVVVLAGMIVAVIAARRFFWRVPSPPLTHQRGWLIPVLCLIGLGLAGYLAYVEMAQVQAVCGPVGDCNTVQQSVYARLFGVLPIGFLGMAGYAMILLAWVIGRFAGQRLAGYASLAMLGMTAFGVLFSIYLTFLEPFVIGATCAWCLTSAILMTALFWLSLAPGRAALSYPG
jgi:uncharacterized membrane protein